MSVAEIFDTLTPMVAGIRVDVVTVILAVFFILAIGCGVTYLSRFMLEKHCDGTEYEKGASDDRR
jgi:hypothetical protein